MRINYILIALSTFAIVVVTAPVAKAEISFSVSPIRMELSGEPGGSYTDAIEIHNEGNERVRIKVTMQDWYLSKEGTPIFQKIGTQAHSCSGWMKINPVDFLLQPKERKLVRYSVAIPTGTKAGGYWGAFVFETLPFVEPGQKAKAVSLKGNIASIVYITAGKPAPAGDLVDMRYEETKEGGKVTFTMQNTGEVHFRLKGDLKIADEAGKLVQTIPVPDTPVLPGFTRTVAISLKEKPAAGKYSATATIDIGTKALLAGDISFNVK